MDQAPNEGRVLDIVDPARDIVAQALASVDRTRAPTVRENTTRGRVRARGPSSREACILGTDNIEGGPGCIEAWVAAYIAWGMGKRVVRSLACTVILELKEYCGDELLGLTSSQRCSWTILRHLRKAIRICTLLGRGDRLMPENERWLNVVGESW